MKNNKPYTRDEVIKYGNDFPDRGIFYPKCRTNIPQFVELDEKDINRIRQLIESGKKMKAIEELRSKTGCSLRWAKIWVIHSGRPAPDLPGPPCPYCDKPLQTSLAKQCPHCFMDWHDENN